MAGGVEPSEAAKALPDQLWAESWTHASRSAGARRQRHHAKRLRYLAVQGVSRFPEVFGLDEYTAAPWKAAYEAALHEHLDLSAPDEDPHRAPDLFTVETLWSHWDAQFPTGDLKLPAALPEAVSGDDGRRELCKRQVARTLLGQTFRLTDTILDLYFADEKSEHDGRSAPALFLDWLQSADLGGQQIRRDCNQWLTHLRLIVDSCLEGAGRPYRELAREESWPQLYNPQPVIGVTGGSGGHRMATRQFRTPSMPRVIVCTDTLKEGVDLHLFCDQVVHYGVAWTSGDLEQRVGRVDRYFSQIERRLLEDPPPDVHLAVGYPHIEASLEKGQVARVIDRQRQAELLMDSPLAGAQREERDLIVGATTPRARRRRLEPYRPDHFPDTGRSVVVVSTEEARTLAEHYTRWYGELTRTLNGHGWRISPADATPVRVATLYGQGRQHQLEWSFEPALGRYILTLSNPPWPADAVFSGGRRRRIVDRRRRVETFVRLLVPTLDEGLETQSIARFVAALDGVMPAADDTASVHWATPLEAVAADGVNWVNRHKAELVVPRGARAHGVTLYAYDHGVRVVGLVAPLHELEHRWGWNGEPTAAHVRDWAWDMTNDLALGYLDVRESEGLVFGNHVLHGALSAGSRLDLVEQVAWRADAWEAALTGEDRR